MKPRRSGMLRILKVALSAILAVSFCIPAFAIKLPGSDPYKAAGEIVTAITSTDSKNTVDRVTRIVKSTANAVTDRYVQPVEVLCDKKPADEICSESVEAQFILAATSGDIEKIEAFITELVADTAEDLADVTCDAVAGFLEADSFRDGKDAFRMAYREYAFSLVDDYVIKISPFHCYNTKTNTIGTINGKGFAGIGFDYDVCHNTWTSSQNAWQKAFGYSKYYDALAPLFFMYFDTIRFPFEYDGDEWQVQIWKGKYGLTSGAEVGVYKKDANTGVFVGVDDEDLALISIDLYNDDGLLLTLDEQYHWWLTGFKLFTTYFADDLTLVTSIDLGNEMLTQAFVEAIEAAKSDYPIEYAVSGTIVAIAW